MARSKGVGIKTCIAWSETLAVRAATLTSRFIDTCNIFQSNQQRIREGQVQYFGSAVANLPTGCFIYPALIGYGYP